MDATIRNLLVFLLLILIYIKNGISSDTSTHKSPTDFLGRSCPSDHFRCNSGRCIPNRWVCDYQPECENGEDEHQSCPPPQCGSNQFACEQYVFNQTYCIPRHHQCDRVVDCVDGTDEASCTYRTCAPTDVKCKNGFCIPAEKRCNGYYDCRDNVDEIGCNMTSCSLEQFRCADGSKCLEEHKKCDYHDDCADKSDEKDCNFPACHEGQFRCANSICIPMRWRCDGHHDCSDQSDEQNCTSVTCDSTSFQCQQGGCIERTKLCDGHKDCDDGSDEKACSESRCSSMGCEHGCQPSLDGGVCTCMPGTVLDTNNNRNCIDRNECQEWGFCDQFCTNLQGDYKCSCAQGYTLRHDNTCETNFSSNMRLAFASQDSIYRLDRDGAHLDNLSNASNAAGVDFHYRRKMIFWSDLLTRKIYSMFVNGSPVMANHEDLTFPGEWTPVSMAVDWVGDKLYVCDQVSHMITVLELTGRWKAIVIGIGLNSPNDITVDPTQGFLFVADGDRVVRANMDGTNVKHIIKDATYKVTGLTLDYVNKRVFWCDSLLDYIGTADYQGGQRFQVIRGSTNIPAPNKMTMFENQLYWTDSTRQGVVRINKFNSTKSVKIIYRNRTAVSEFRGIKAMHPSRQPEANNPCEHTNGGCQHMCLVTRNAEDTGLGFRCFCNIGYRLQNDERNCHLLEEFLLFSQQKFIRGMILDSVMPGFQDAMVPIVSRTARYVGLDFDADHEYIYYSDVIQDVIYRIRLNGSGRESVLASQNEGVEGLALDWITRNLYYIDSRKGTLNVLRTANFTHRRTLLSELRRPRGLAVHPIRGFVFYSEWDRPANITRAFLDGTNATVLKGLVLGWPNGLAVDAIGDRLYWCDALLDHIQHSKLDGTDVQTISSRQIRHPFSLTVTAEHLYVTDWRLDAILQLDKITGQNEKIVASIGDTNRLYGVKIYNRKLQPTDRNHPCIFDNGGCEKFCFGIPHPSNERLVVQCGCPYGEKLQTDNRTCSLDPHSEPPQQACPNPWDFTCGNQRCIPKTWVCDGDDDCMDNSDELANCTKPSCSPDQHRCANGHCIPKAFVCDSDNDCIDFSDESGCSNVTCPVSD